WPPRRADRGARGVAYEADELHRLRVSLTQDLWSAEPRRPRGWSRRRGALPPWGRTPLAAGQRGEGRDRKCRDRDGREGGRDRPLEWRWDRRGGDQRQRRDRGADQRRRRGGDGRRGRRGGP